MKAWDWNFKVGTIAGIKIYVHWILIFYIVFELWKWFQINRFVHGLCLYSILWFIILAHELGHCFMARRCHQKAEKIILWPLGGLAMVGQSKKHSDNVWISFGGPLANIIAAVLLLALMQIFQEPVDIRMFGLNHIQGYSLLADVFNLNWILLLFNLLVPVEPLDGGAIFSGLLSMKFAQKQVLIIKGIVAIIIGLAFLSAGFILRNILVASISAFVCIQGVDSYRRGKQIPDKKKKKKDSKEEAEQMLEADMKRVQEIAQEALKKHKKENS